MKGKFYVFILLLNVMTGCFNVSIDVLDSFFVIDEGLERTTKTLVVRNETIYDIFDAQMTVKVSPFRDMAYKVKEIADQLEYDIQQLKVEMIRYCDGQDAPSLTPVDRHIGRPGKKMSTCHVNSRQIIHKGSMNRPSEIMILNGKAGELKKKIDNYRDFLINITFDVSVKHTLEEILNTYDTVLKTGIAHTWESHNFERLPLIAVITNLSRLQNNVRNAEAYIVQNLLSMIGSSDIRVNRMEAIVMTKSYYVKKGSQFEARVLLAAYDSLYKPEILIGKFRKTNNGYEMIDGGTPLPYDNMGRAMVIKQATSVGTFTFEGLMKVFTPDGLINFPFSTVYHVVE